MAKKDLYEIHEEALNDFNKIQMAMRDERLQCLNDRRFYSIAGAQWEGPLGEQFENKPRFEINKVHLSVIRIINEYRNNRITVNFSSKEGDEYSKLADVCAGLYRADEQDSQAQEAYDNAFEEAVGGGFGAWRLRAEYEDDEDLENEAQRIRIEPIFDADSSVFFDLNAKRQDKSDAKYCYVLTAMTPEAYKEEFGEDVSSVPKAIQAKWFDWNTPSMVYVAEYYRVDDATETVQVWAGMMGEEERFTQSELTDEKIEELTARGFEMVRSRKVKRKKVRKYIMSGHRILEDCGYIAGSCIPIIPTYGKRWFVDNVERCMGHVRLAKDSQRIKNMQLSKLGEISALSAYQKPILTPEQVAGHEIQWAEDNIKNYPYLLVNPIVDMNGNISASGPVAYTQPPQVPPAMAALLQITDMDMNDVLGNQQAGEQVVSAMSGKAVELVQNRLDMQTFIYVSNFAKAMKRCGEVWLSMARDIFVEEGRKMKTVGAQEEVDYIEIAKPIMSEEGEVKFENDLSNAKFDVAVDVGPSSSSKRASTVRALTGMMQITADPETLQVLGAMAMMNMEGEGVDDVRGFYRKKLIRLGVVKPTKSEAEELMQELQNQQPDAQAQYLQAAAAEAQAKSVKAQADTALAMAKAEETKAKTFETMTNLTREGRVHVIETAQRLNEMTASNQEAPQE